MYCIAKVNKTVRLNVIRELPGILCYINISSTQYPVLIIPCLEMFL